VAEDNVGLYGQFKTRGGENRLLGGGKKKSLRRGRIVAHQPWTKMKKKK